MKRLLTLAGLALASLIGAFAFTAPAHAAVTCTSPTTSGTNTYPQNYLWICNGTGTVTTGDVNAVNGALGHLGNVNTGIASDAKTRMQSNNHYIYVFKNDTDYNSYCTTAGNITANPPIPFCITLLSSDVAKTATGANPSESIIIADRVNAAANTTMANTAVHEAGHQLDWIYGVALNGSGYISSPGNTPATTNEFAFKLTGMKATFSGSVITAGDTLSLTFSGTNLGSTVTITHNVVGGDTLTSIASDFATKINANGSLTAAAIGANATSSGATLSVTTNATAGSVLTYGNSSTGTGGHAATETITQSKYDWPAFDTLTPCSASSGIFAGQKGHDGKYICSSLAQGTVGGTIHTGDIMGITVTDTSVPALLSPNPRSVAYTVQAGDTTTKIAAGLAAAINNDTGAGSLQAAGITATSSGAVLSISSGTNNSTYAYSPGMGTTETLTGLGTVTAGNGNTKSNAYSSGTTNDATLQAAWPYYFSNGGSTIWRELFAEQTAVSAGGQVAPGNATQDHYLNSGKFPCSLNFVNAIENSGSVPSTTNWPYSSLCK